MIEKEAQQKLTKLEQFYQFSLKGLVEKLTEKEKTTYSIVALISTLSWLIASLLGIFLGLIWVVFVSAIVYRAIYIGINSKAKWMSIIAIGLYIINMSLYILVAIFLII